MSPAIWIAASALALSLAGVLWLLTSGRPEVEERLADWAASVDGLEPEAHTAPPPPPPPPTDPPFRERVLATAARHLAHAVLRYVDPRQMERLSIELSVLGRGETLAAPVFVGISVLSTVAGAATALLLGFTILQFTGSELVLAFIGGATLGYLSPRMLHMRRLRARREDFRIALPAIVDQLALNVQAGLSIDQGLAEACGTLHSPLTNEFRRVLVKINGNIPRQQALQEWADRVGIPEADAFVGALLQASATGASVANVLQVQARSLRKARQQRAEEKGNKAPIKMLIPMIVFIIPTLLIVLLGPAGLTVWNLVLGKG
jgi:tight adherence protein C